MDNLINFDGEAEEIESKKNNETNPSEMPLLPSCAIVATDQTSDNNPFDELQKIAESLDPFEIVEQEVKKAKSMPVEVKLENLLSLTDDSISIENEVARCEDRMSPALEMTKNHNIDMCSPITHVGFSSDLENESPPAGVMNKWTPDSNDSPLSHTSTEGSISNPTSRIATKKCLEYRKRLLKLSISNSNNNSPLSRNTASVHEPSSSAINIPTDNDNQLTSLSQVESLTSIQIIESGLSKKQEEDFEADLQMLTLPILEKLRSPAEKTKAAAEHAENTCETSTLISDSKVKPHLEGLREKLRCKRQEANNKDIHSVINNLKSLIHDIDLVDEGKKQHANELLDLLLKDLSTDQVEVPQPMVRQGTFDIELQKTDEQHVQNQDQELISEVEKCSTKCSSTEKTADIMNCSSATYDLEVASAKNGELHSLAKYVTPTVQHPSPLCIETTPSTHMPVNFDELIEQIGKVLEGQLHVGQSSAQNSADAQPVTQTVIVVMNTPQLINDNSTAQTVEAGEYDNSDDHDDNYIRRRSQSLTLHDKMKILKLPRPVPRPAVPDLMNPASVTETDFKTPAKPIKRRNSFSSVKTCTPIVTPANTPFQDNGKPTLDTKSVTGYQRGFRPLATHHENPIQVSGRDGPASKSAFSAFKPDLRSRYRSNSSAVSILKSSAPLKATVPIKKVAPLPKSAGTSTTHQEVNNLNSSLHFLRNAGKIPCTSTPTSHRSGRADISAVFEHSAKPSTASAVHTSPLKRLSTARTSIYATYREKANSTHANKNNLATTLKSKSPVKQRKSGVPLAGVGLKTLQGRTSTTVKGINNSASSSAAESRVGSFGFRSRSFSHGSAGLRKNKENEKL